MVMVHRGPGRGVYRSRVPAKITYLMRAPRGSLAGLLAEHPVDGVREVGFPAAVGTDNRGHTRTDEKRSSVQLGEDLNPLKFDALSLSKFASSQSDRTFSPGPTGPRLSGMRPW